MGRLLKWFVPWVWEDGFARCNALGKELAGGGPVGSFLDVGCGDGAFTMELAALIDPDEITGIEYVDELRESATDRGIACSKGDLNETWGLESDRFDLILSSQSIEHVHNTRLYLEEAYRCLRPGGHLVLMTENLSSWGNIAALVMGWQPFTSTHINGWDLGNPLIWNQTERAEQVSLQEWQATGVSGTAGHVRVLAYLGLKELLVKVGFTEVELLTRGYLPLRGRLSDLFCRIDPRHGQFLIATCNKPHAH